MVFLEINYSLFFLPDKLLKKEAQIKNVQGFQVFCTIFGAIIGLQNLQTYDKCWLQVPGTQGDVYQLTSWNREEATNLWSVSV